LPAATLLPIELSIGERGMAPRVPMPKLPSCELLSNDIVIDCGQMASDEA